MHKPNLDINAVLAAEGRTLQEVHQPVSIWNTNFFKVKWDEDAFPSLSDGCGTCTTLADGCLCDVSVSNQIEFESFPTAEEVLSQLKVGSVPVDWLEVDYELTQSTADVEMYNKIGTTNFAVDTIFAVRSEDGESKSCSP